MNFWQEHFDHLLLSIFIVLFGAATVLMYVYHAPETEVAFFGGAFTGFTSALLMRMRGPSANSPPPPPPIKPE